MGPKKRTAVLINTCLFCILSFFFNLVVFSLGKGNSVLSIVNDQLVMEYTLLLSLAGLSILTIYRVKKISIFFYTAFILTVLFSTLSVFLDSFDKVILGLNFIFAVLSYYFYLLLRAELAEPYYNPGYSEGQLRSYVNKDLVVKILSDKIELSGVLTNWGESGFFCQLGEDKPSGKVSFSISFRGKVFEGSGIVVYHSKSGIGVIDSSKNEAILGWKQFYGIMDEFGIKPKMQVS